MEFALLWTDFRSRWWTYGKRIPENKEVADAKARHQPGTNILLVNIRSTIYVDDTK